MGSYLPGLGLGNASKFRQCLPDRSGSGGDILAAYGFMEMKKHG
jgi:hypothetical protein